MIEPSSERFVVLREGKKVTITVVPEARK